MLTKKENERLTRVGPGTPMGELLRRYWHPIAATAQLDEDPVRKVMILGESLGLFKDRQGRLGLIGDRCAHRLTGLELGIPQDVGIRCPYHGWQYDGTGRCLDTPLEPPGSRLKEKVRITAYPVQELGGLVWAYLGHEPAPLLPRWELLVREGAFRQILTTTLPCNWLQVMENRLDPAHGVYLHGYFFQYILEREGQLEKVPDDRMEWTNRRAFTNTRGIPTKLFFERWEHGFLKFAERDGGVGRTQQGTVVFPYGMYHGGPDEIRRSFQWGVPIDDTHTWHISYYGYVPGHGVEVPMRDTVGYADVPLTDEEGKRILNYTLAQDMVAWYSQGEITDRSKEKLGVTDAGIIKYRRLLQEQVNLVQDGGEPMTVFRDPATNVSVKVPYDRKGRHQFRETYHLGYITDDVDRYCPDTDVIMDLMAKSEEARAAGR